jgi:hypothetical protein
MLHGQKPLGTKIYGRKRPEQKKWWWLEHTLWISHIDMNGMALEWNPQASR